jgi:hypothetical protein
MRALFDLSISYCCPLGRCFHPSCFLPFLIPYVLVLLNLFNIKTSLLAMIVSVPSCEDLRAMLCWLLSCVSLPTCCVGTAWPAC